MAVVAVHKIPIGATAKVTYCECRVEVLSDLRLKMLSVCTKHHEAFFGKYNVGYKWKVTPDLLLDYDALADELYAIFE